MTDILDLRHATSRLMRPLLEQEAVLWEDLLRWDYRPSVELLLDYLDNRVLPGFVARDGDTLLGYSFGVYEAQKAVLGDCYAPSAFRHPPGSEGKDPVLRQLLTSLIALLQASPGVERIESQLLLFPAGSLTPILAAEGFRSFPRFFMECTLGPANGTVDLPLEALLGDDLSLRRWVHADYNPAAELIQLAYEGHVDAEINDQYRTLHGSLRFLHNIVRFPGCGVFEPSHSWVLNDRRTGALVGMLLCSRVAGEVAHITQLCIAPALRKRRLGYALLLNNMRSLARAGYTALSLTVTASNSTALRLYQQAGFTVRRDFDAAVYQRPAPPPLPHLL